MSRFKTSPIEAPKVAGRKPAEVPYSIYCDGFSVQGKLKIDLDRFAVAAHSHGWSSEFDLLEKHCAADVTDDTPK